MLTPYFSTRIHYNNQVKTLHGNARSACPCRNGNPQNVRDWSHGSGETHLSHGLRHDKCRCPDGAPRWRMGDEKFKKNPIPAVPRRGPEAGSFVEKTIFMVLA
jgi:hypothetical protein